MLATVDRGRRDRLQPLTRCMPCSSHTARSVQTLGFCVFQCRPVGHLQPWAEVWGDLFMLRARRIVMRTGICTLHRTLLDLNQLEPRSYLSSVYTHCVYLFRHRITGARGGVLRIRLNANSLPGLYSDVEYQHPASIT